MKHIGDDPTVEHIKGIEQYISGLLKSKTITSDKLSVILRRQSEESAPAAGYQEYLREGLLPLENADREEKRYFIAVSPQFKTVDLYDHQMKKIKREELLKPEQKQTTGKKQSAQQKVNAPYPAKKKGNERKMTV